VRIQLLSVKSWGCY